NYDDARTKSAPKRNLFGSARKAPCRQWFFCSRLFQTVQYPTSCRIVLHMPKQNYYGLILAGGRGTRFWPRSRRARAKQVLNVVGENSLIQNTVERLTTLI